MLAPIDNLAFCYSNGKGTEQNHTQALKCYNKAKELGM